MCITTAPVLPLKPYDSLLLNNRDGVTNNTSGCTKRLPRKRVGWTDLAYPEDKTKKTLPQNVFDELDCITIKDVNLAARQGDIFFLEHLWSRSCKFVRSSEGALFYDDKVRRVEKNLSVCIVSNAIESDRMEILEWYKSKNLGWSEWNCRDAANHGNVRMLKYLRENGCPWSVNTLKEACGKGHIDVILWAISNGCEMDKMDMLEACRRNARIVVEYALKKKIVALDSSLCAAAACGGHINLLKWLRDQGCPWDESTILVAFERNRLDVLEWSLRNGCPIDGITSDHLEKMIK